MLRALLLLLTVAGLFAPPAMAQGQIPPAQIAVIDIERVMVETRAAQSVRRQVQAFREQMRERFAGEEQELRREERELKRQSGTLDPATFDQRRREFERRVIDAQRRAQDASRQLDLAAKKALGEIQTVLIPVVKLLTEEMGFNIVVDKSQILFAVRTLDITEQVIRDLDQQIAEVTVKVP